MINNISDINSEFLIINYIFSNLTLSRQIFEVLTEEDFFFKTTKDYFFKKKNFLNIDFFDEKVLLSNLKNLLEKSKKRKMLKIIFNISFELMFYEKLDEKIFEKINFLQNFKKNNVFNKKQNYKDLLFKFFTQKENFFNTGYKTLDNLINGLQKGNLIIIAGRPSIGKTSFSLNLIKNLILSNKKIIIYTLEMTRIQIFLRLISIILEVNQNNFKENHFSDLDFKKISFLIKNYNFENLIIKDCSSLSSNDIEVQLEYYKKKNFSIEIIIIDYIQLMKSEFYSNNRVLEISDISRSLKLIAKHFDCVLIALSQLNRLIEYRLEKTPILSDLRDSGSIEQDADIVIFLNKKKFNFVDIIIAKNRNGPLGIVNFIFKNEYTKFLQI
ncbi:DnaB-like helicase C-terminal domain-containing protein [Candidatus Carsonella ruddii]|uniref:DnaB-like helicase C-terminal domain-containing protein n=4 Tax=cellular organisms TaxID=131567 RepID=A0AAJ6JSX0_CARRU|nr:DnaB-like helicase C-terminal domain-containing protein [Candidatus Carsonella ruddii]WGS66733.1 DnaB-like helicase C-terminal domain-containing protein [Candidatus Carsonella ruddii]WGS66927.1 DnaB-like helicase C-terminal domain-containing protein [Candidatus Carsonella ruddii]WGS67119.1 DnaB-like helicase C-terminal domain-containing protein [Candidatus Carsonella ruddii]WGS67311.1 DnaB-like helicase C-terminal domain-containing protein [Candidatus Carsonella ruddii]WMC18328.1 MAG: DnaB-